MISTLFGDFIYFNHVHRHLAGELFQLGNDAGLLGEVLKNYWVHVLFILAFFVVLAKVFIRIHKSPLNELPFNFQNVVLFTIIFLCLVVGIRGKIQGKPFGIVDAYSTNKASSGNLALNGIYSAFRNSSNKNKAYHYTSDSRALALTQQLLEDESFEFTDPNFPLLRKLKVDPLSTDTNTDIEKPQYNIVILLLESWSSIFVDSFTHNNFGVTPNFDEIVKESVQYTNFFANGQRSIDGVTALFAGIPRVEGMSLLGSGLEMSNISLLGNIAKNNNYQTLAMQSSKRSSFRLDSIAKLAGFDDYYGSEDIPQLGIETSGKQPYFGTWDNNTLDFFHHKMDQLTPPFMAFAFTSTTHVPYISPGKEWEKYPHDENNIFGYLNTLKYADESLGRFMAKAKQSDWFANTIFIIMADHTLGFGDNRKDFEGTDLKTEYRPLENMRIPMAIYAPGILPARVDDRIASQADLMPSLIDLLGWKGEFSSMSKSVFSDSPGFVIFGNGPVIGFVNDQGYLLHSLQTELENTIEDPQATDSLLSSYQSITRLLRENNFVSH
ncbi:MAG: LTA synthase family protein [Pseudomonadales bacterium]|nr:LTA synthase family protein [Pseudomonadales bacterium]